MNTTKNIASLLNSQTGTGVNWQDNFKFQDGLINNRGQVVVHETAISCPRCRGGDITDPVIGPSGSMSCDECENGILYRNTHQVMVLISGIGGQRQLLESGFATPGDCVCSFSPNVEIPPSDFDKIIFTWPENINEGQVIVRGAESAQKILDLKENEDRLHYVGAKSIYVEDEFKNTYNQNADFYFEGKKIVWINPPKINSRYVIKYQGYLEWIAFSNVFSRRDRDRDLGYRVVLRKKHITNTRDGISNYALDEANYLPRVSA